MHTLAEQVGKLSVRVASSPCFRMNDAAGVEEVMSCSKAPILYYCSPHITHYARLICPACIKPTSPDGMAEWVVRPVPALVGYGIQKL